MSDFSDIEYAEGIINGNTFIENEFYMDCRQHFHKHKSKTLLAYPEGSISESDVFIESVVQVMQEIKSYRIKLADGVLYRQDKDGLKKVPSLKHLMMGVVNKKTLEAVRKNNPAAIIPLTDNEECPEFLADYDEELTENQIVELCVEMLPPRCKEILKMFYYQRMDLDEILLIRQENNSKNGLKSSKWKCVKRLGNLIKGEFSRRHLKLYGHATR